MPGTERADIVAGHQLAAALADQVNFELGVVVPARQVIGVVVFEPAEAVVRLGQDDFEFGGAVLEQFGAADGHGDASFTAGIPAKYPRWQRLRYPRFRSALILF